MYVHEKYILSSETLCVRIQYHLVVTSSCNHSMLKMFSKLPQPPSSKRLEGWGHKMLNLLIIFNIHGDDINQALGPVDGGWTSFTYSWSPCTVTCGGGIQSGQEHRSCTNPRPSIDGKPCVGSPHGRKASRNCNTQSCPGTRYFYVLLFSLSSHSDSIC
jgi:hypothetical protein